MLYDLLLILGKFGVTVASVFNKKAALWCKGQKGLLENVESSMRGVEGNVVWFHCASLGEFEQGRPLIEDWKDKNPADSIVLTFFSPSGYEVRKNYKGADHVFYLPLDISYNARAFVRAINPKCAIFIKYEYWNNYTKELQKIGAKSYVVSAIFRENDTFFRPWGGLYANILRRYDRLFLQNESSRELLHKIGIDNTTVCGDTRFDRVANLEKSIKIIPKVEAFTANEDVFIVGSSWPKDDEITIDLIGLFPKMKFIIVPHEIDEAKIVSIVDRCEALGRKTVRYSKDEDLGVCADASVMVIDVIGVLSSTYHYCKYAYIGGGFGVGIHNTLEAATFGLPIIFGPNYKRFDEAIGLVDNQIATPIASVEEAHKWLSEMSEDGELYKKTSAAAKMFVSQNSGATKEILRHI
ncbi:MAG: glycosyltransferase N-terminal domain-containing protein [Rikenellaceae bacterium]